MPLLGNLKSSAKLWKDYLIKLKVNILICRGEEFPT